eukprot:scaffold457062_cov51-Prasinocladus_malaysianus.AAC.1
MVPEGSIVERSGEEVIPKIGVVVALTADSPLGVAVDVAVGAGVGVDVYAGVDAGVDVIVGVVVAVGVLVKIEAGAD